MLHESPEGSIQVLYWPREEERRTGRERERKFTPNLNTVFDGRDKVQARICNLKVVWFLLIQQH